MRAAFYSSRAWRDARLRALERDDHRCTAEELDGTRCDERGPGLHVDHVEPVELLIVRGQATELDLLQTLCPSHHSQLEWMRRRARRERMTGELLAA